jgi:hypothetical protein
LGEGRGNNAPALPKTPTNHISKPGECESDGLDSPAYFFIFIYLSRLTCHFRRYNLI